MREEEDDNDCCCDDWNVLEPGLTEWLLLVMRTVMPEEEEAEGRTYFRVDIEDQKIG